MEGKNDRTHMHFHMFHGRLFFSPSFTSILYRYRAHDCYKRKKNRLQHFFFWFLFYLILLLTPEMYNSTTEHCFSFSHRCAIGFKSMACNPRLAGDRIACTLYNFFQFKTKSKAKKKNNKQIDEKSKRKV